MEQRKVMRQANQHHGDVFSQVVTPKQTIKGTDATTQTSGLEYQKAQVHGGHKAWQEPKSSQKNMDIKCRSKQANRCIKKMIQTL